MLVVKKFSLLVLCGVALAASSAAQEQLEQGWTQSERTEWYSITQGSRLIPDAWLRALEQPGRPDLFLAPDHVRALRYIPRDGMIDGKPALPVGFAIDRQSDRAFGKTQLRWFEQQRNNEPWVGLNCAACHTNDIAYQGKVMRIEGGATLADFQSFRETLIRALNDTRTDSAKFDRFAARVLANRDTEQNRRMLSEAVTQLLAWEERVERQSATALRYGFGRLDAVGHILNKVALATGADQVPFPADAPVSYPFIWNAPQHDRVQWNGVAKNSAKPIGIPGKPIDLGALARNTAEVIGVFADIKIGSGPLYDSSAHVENLIQIERQVGRLKSPAWPAHILGAIDETKAKRGAELFAGKCAGCHDHLARDELGARIRARMQPLSRAGTDIWMACNAYTYQARSGALTGTLLLDRTRIKSTDDGLKLLTASVTGVIVQKWSHIVGTLVEDFFAHPKDKSKTIDTRIRSMMVDGPFSKNAALVANRGKLTRAALCAQIEGDLNAATGRRTGDDAHLLSYKARPLNGIWATPPYLHNGSVPSLYDLLLPAKLRPLFATVLAPPPQGPFRPERFFVGTREFDPIKVGFRTDRSEANSFEFRVVDDRGVEILGNSNSGHDYGNATLTDDDRWAIVEYLKTL